VHCHPSELRNDNLDRRETSSPISLDVTLLSHVVLIPPVALGPAVRERILLRMATGATLSLSSPEAQNVASERSASLAWPYIAPFEQQ
jgi:hypothetical protein